MEKADGTGEMQVTWLVSLPDFFTLRTEFGSWGRKKAQMGLSSVPTPSSLPWEISQDSFNFSHKLLVEKIRFSIIAEHLA